MSERESERETCFVTAAQQLLTQFTNNMQIKIMLMCSVDWPDKNLEI